MARKKTAAEPAAEPAAPAADAPAAAGKERSNLEGRTIKEVRPMKPAEMKQEGWEAGRNGAPSLIVLDDGTKLYPSRDDEGNGPGALFGVDKEGCFRVG